MTITLALDLGEKRIGLAASDGLGLTARALEAIDATDEPAALSRIGQIALERGAARVVVGLPVNMDGREGPAAKKARAFAKRLRAALPESEIALWDERLTTQQAARNLAARGHMSRVKQKRLIDALAAQALLQSYLDARGRASRDDDEKSP